MYKPLSLRKNFSWTFAGNVVNAVSLWGIIALATRLGDAAIVGRFELSRVIAMSLMAVAMPSLRTILVTDAKNEYSFADYLGARLTLTVLSVLGFVIVGWGWYSGEMAWVILLWGLAKSIDFISDIFRGLFQRYECMNLSGVSLMIKGPAALLGMGILLWLTGELKLAIIGTIVVWLLVLLLYDIPQAHRLLSYKSGTDGVPYRISPRFNVKVMLPLLWLALPLAIVTLLSSLQQTVPRLVLESYHGEAALGYFGPIAYPIAMGTVIISAMALSASPRLANYYVSNLTAYCRLIRKLLLLGLVMGLLFTAAVVLFGKFALGVLYTAEYAEYHTDFIILSIGATATFMLFFCGHGLTAARALKVQLALATVSCLVMVIISYLLIPRYGLRGAAITSVVTLFVMFGGYFCVLLWVIHKRRKDLNTGDTNNRR